jgi:hypothetical protein
MTPGRRLVEVALLGYCNEMFQLPEFHYRIDAVPRVAIGSRSSERTRHAIDDVSRVGGRMALSGRSLFDSLRSRSASSPEDVNELDLGVHAELAEYGREMVANGARTQVQR